MIDANNACPLSELSYVHTGGCQSLTKSTKYEILQVRYINSRFPQQEKSYTEPELRHTDCRLHIYTNGVIKPALLSHLCSGQSVLKERDLFGFIMFAW